MENKSMEERMLRMEAVHEVQNIMNKYERFLEVGLWDELVDLFALKTPGVKADVGWGIYEGEKSLKNLFCVIHKNAFGDQKTGMRPGVFGTLYNVNPIVEVAEDGKTAVGTWGVLGAGTMRPGGQEGESGYDKGDLMSGWSMCTRETVFILEEGKWKIWQYFVHGYFSCPFDTCWSDLEDPLKFFDHSWLPDELKPDKPSMDDPWLYTPTAKIRNIPQAPEPYKTFEGIKR